MEDPTLSGESNIPFRRMRESSITSTSTIDHSSPSTANGTPTYAQITENRSTTPTITSSADVLSSLGFSIPRPLPTSTYPLANAPTPSSLKRYCAEIDRQLNWLRESNLPQTPVSQLQEALDNLEPCAISQSQHPSYDPSFSRREVGHIARKRSASVSTLTFNKKIRLEQTNINPSSSSTTLPRSKTISTTTDSNAPLPSPSLSPVTASHRLASDSAEGDSASLCSESSSTQALSMPNEIRALNDLAHLMNSFDTLPSDMQSYIMFQLLKRCPRSTLRFVSSIVNPTLRKDFLRLLPFELSLKILKYLDVKSLCNAAQVSKRWQMVVDADPHLWKLRLELDGFQFDDFEEEIAIEEKWQTFGYITYDKHRNDLRKPKSPKFCMHNDLLEYNRLDKFKSTLLGTHNSGSKRTSFKSNMTWHHNLSKFMNGNMDQKKEISQSHYGGVPYSEVEMNEVSMSSFSSPSCVNSLHPTRPTAHPYKSIYRRHKLIANNWVHGRAKRIRFRGHGSNVVTCLQFDSDKIVSGSDDWTINVYDTQTGELRSKFEGHDGGVWALEYVGKMLVSGATDRNVRIWDIDRGICTHMFLGHTGTVRCLQIVLPIDKKYSAHGHSGPKFPVVVTGSRDATLRVWRLPTEQEQNERNSIFLYDSHLDELEQDVSKRGYLQHVLTGHTNAVRSLSAYGSILVSGGYDHTVRVWDIVTGESKWVLTGHREKVYSVVYDPDISGGGKNRRCMSGSMDASVRVWSVEDGTCIWSLEGHSQLVGLLGLHGSTLISAAADCTLRVWDANKGHCKQILAGHDGAITCFQHDQTKCISGSDGALKMWDLSQLDQAVNYSKSTPVRNLIDGLAGVWQCRFDERRCVAAVQRGQQTWFEVLDFGVLGIEDPVSTINDTNSDWSGFSNDEDSIIERDEVEDADMREDLGDVQESIQIMNHERLIQERELLGTPVADEGLHLVDNIGGEALVIGPSTIP